MSRKQQAENGFVIYRGPSMIDGAPIVMISTGHADRSVNKKLGGMLQTWILREDISPMDAIRSGKDSSICGECPHRGTMVKDSTTESGLKNVDRSCYVKAFQAPLVIWKKFNDGGYPDATVFDIHRLFGGKALRFGSYGDPAAIPLWLIESMGEVAEYTTGYTHQWKDCDQGYSKWLMASADNAGDRFFAHANGFRTFRVRGKDEELGEKEIACPASKEMGQKTNCESCKACGGTSAKAKVDIAIIAHGSTGLMNTFEKRKKAFSRAA